MSFTKKILDSYTKHKTDNDGYCISKYNQDLEIENIIVALKSILKVLLPGRFESEKLLTEQVIDDIFKKSEGLFKNISECKHKINFDYISKAVFEIHEILHEDALAAYKGDPAASSIQEVKLTYPGILAIACYRLAHVFYRDSIGVVPRVISEWAHRNTGIDIHPGAKIGSGFFIDHGTGVVIGETTVIGNNVTLYQGVTLGAKNFPLDENGNPIKGIQRHPTLEDGVIIYANATILGGDTVIGKDTTIGANLFITKSIPASCTVLPRTNKNEESYLVVSNN